MTAKADIIDALVAGSLTGAKIARLLCVSRQYVSQVAKEIGVKPYRPAPKPPYQRKPVDPLREQRKKYNEHRRSAKKRCVEFRLTFEEWWGYWEPHYHLRGTTKGCMCMCRRLDQGAYEVGNVRIDYVGANGHEKITSRIVAGGTKWLAKESVLVAADISGCMASGDAYQDPMDILERQQEGIAPEW